MRVLLTSDLHFGFNDDRKKDIELHTKPLQEQKDYDIMVIAGDIISHNYKKQIHILEIIRSITTKPILVVLGNHDYWSKDTTYLRTRVEFWKQELQKHNMVYLSENNPFEFMGYNFWGIDTWYKNTDHFNCTNDYNFLPRFALGDFIYDIMKKREDTQIQHIISNINKNDKNILVTHFSFDDNKFSASSRILDFLKPSIDVVLYGHSHKFKDEVRGGIRFINSGSDYNNPKYYNIDLTR